MPDVIMIQGLCLEGKFEDAWRLLYEMAEKGFNPDTYYYNEVKNGLIGDPQHIFHKMEKLGCCSSITTFNSLIDGFCKTGKLDEAHLLFCKMEIGRKPSLFLRLSQGFNRVLDSVGLQTMVKNMCDIGSVQKAYKLLIEVYGK